MSQEKVNRYKEEKANRKKTIARMKFRHKVNMVLGTVVAIAIVVGIGFAVYSDIKSKQPTSTIYCQTQALSDYISNLTSE